MYSEADFDQQLFQELDRLIAPIAPTYEQKGDLGERFRDAIRGIELRDRPRTSRALEAIAAEQKRLSKEHRTVVDVARQLLLLPPADEREPFDYGGYLTELKAGKERMEEGQVWTKEKVRTLIWMCLGSLLLPVGIAFQDLRLAGVGAVGISITLLLLYIEFSMRKMNRQGLETTNLEIARIEEHLARSESKD